MLTHRQEQSDDPQDDKRKSGYNIQLVDDVANESEVIEEAAEDSKSIQVYWYIGTQIADSGIRVYSLSTQDAGIIEIFAA